MLLSLRQLSKLALQKVEYR